MAKVRREMQRQDKAKQGNYQSEQTNVAIAARENQQQQRPRGGDECHQRQNHGVESVGHYLVPTQTMYAITAVAPIAIHPA